MSINDLISVVVSVALAAQPTVEAFGTPNFVAYFPSTYWQSSGDRIRFYPTASVLTELVADGFPVTHPVYRACEVAASQETPPSQIAVSRRGLAPVQTLTMTCTDATAGDKYFFTVVGYDGVSHSYTYVSTGVPATDASAIAALVTASNVGTITVVSATIHFTETSGNLVDLLQWSPNLTIADTTADPGITTDLAAINAVNTLGWYSVSLDSSSHDQVKNAAAWVEGTGQGGKVGFFESADTANVTAGSNQTQSIDVYLQAEGYVKSLLQQSNSQVLSVGGFAMACIALGMSPGSYSLAYKAPIGVLPDTPASMSETQQLVLNTASVSTPGTGGYNGNWYQTIAGLNITFPGVTPGGRWMDLTIFIDWFQANLQADLLAYFAGLPKVPLTDNGILGAKARIKSRIKTAASDPYDAIDLTLPWGVSAPTAATLSQTDRNNRNIPGLSAYFTYTSAGNTAAVGVTVTQ